MSARHSEPRGAPGDWRTEVPQGYRLLTRVEEEPLWTLVTAKDAAGRSVLLKLFSPLVRNQEELRSEVIASLRLSEKLGHPQILRPSAIVAQGRPLAAVYDCRAGETLRHRLRKGKGLEVAEGCRMVLQVALGIQHLHQEGHVQGLLTPASICVDQEGNPLLHEVALARLAALIQERGAPNIRCRYAPYLSPEQLADSPQATFLSDVYGLGVLLYELLTGQTPFIGSTVAEVAAQQVRNTAPSARRLNPKVPESLDALVGRCLAHEPQQRFPSCAALMDALEAELLRLPGRKAPRAAKRKGEVQFSLAEAEAASLPERAAGVRRLWGPVLVGVVVVGLLAAGGLLVLNRKRPEPSPPLVEVEPRGEVATVASQEGAGNAPVKAEQQEKATVPAAPGSEAQPGSAVSSSTAPPVRPLPAAVTVEVRAGGLPVAAEVFVDGSSRGAVDERGALGLQLWPEERHTLRVTRPGFVAWDTTLALRAGENRSIRVELRPQAGATVEVTLAKVDFADYVRIDDAGEARQLPVTLRLPVGRHVLEYLDREGNRMWRGEQVFDLQTAQQYLPKAVVEFAELAVVVENAAEVGYGYVLIDGQEWKSGGTSATPMRTLVPAGQHRIRLVRDGFRAVPTDTTVSLHPGQQMRVGFRLYPAR
ncbi:MAG: protein kinase [Calditrichaeota bacterium]|nr:protein kinase [Calditrichota bacterium]